MLGIALAALVPGRHARIVQASLATVGGLSALFFLGVQAKMNVLCPYCAVVDGAALGLSALSVARWRAGWDPPPGRAIPGAAVVGIVVAVGAPLLIGFQRRVIPTDLPPPIAEEMKRTGSGKVTVVDFVDFECPFCRMTHTELAPVLEQRKAKVRLVRKHVPLQRIHKHAMDAARAGCCGESLGKGDEMADALFKAPAEELTPEGCEKLAKENGLDVERFRACVRDPATVARIERDKEAFRAAKGHGLPTIWVDGARLEGAQEADTLASTIDAAIRAM
jgi:protein-disulfide isomerase